MRTGKETIDTSLPQWTNEQGAATITALLAVVAVMGVCGAFLTTTLRSQMEREGTVDEYAAVQAADAGVTLAMARLTQGNLNAIGSDDVPWDFGSAGVTADIVDNEDGTYTITSRSEVARANAAVEAVVAFGGDSEVFMNAVFAGNSSGNNGYTLKINGKDEFADQILGDMYSGGSINFLQDSFLDGTARAADKVLGNYSGEDGTILANPDLDAMNYEATATFDVAAMFDADDAFYASAAPGGNAWQLPEESPGHIFRKNPSDRTSRLNMTDGDDYFLEDPYEPNGRDATQTGIDPSEITLSGVNGQPGIDSNRAVFYIDGNLWMDNAPTYSFRFAHGLASGIQITFVVKGNIYFGDNLFYENPDTDGIVFIAMKDPDVEDSGNISFGDPTGGTLKEMHAFMYAENDFVDINLDKRGSESVTLIGNMTAGNHVDIQRDYGAKHTQMTVDFDERIMDGTLDQPGIPANPSSDSDGSLTVLSWRILSDYDVTNVSTDSDYSVDGGDGSGTTGDGGDTGTGLGKN